MSQLIVNIQDKVISQMFAYTAQHQVSFDEMTEKLWVEFLQKQSQKQAIDEDFLQLLDKTKGIWQHGDGLAFQEKLRSEWE
ncbi:hypothetical protein [Wielerella bovis]|uniref:hypothetical protein n=1 Tax=Wielerella bovis TaxID=2917790 RepID=UPI0020194B37|nr:hypothetical protein [Wielerella bovis]ULJ60586.1 hypothetical protein MIS44_01515 [Wielerella bovis]ULJ62797.1 hypothetical protein MIS46_01565 [Wielerella bovis]ULJ65025.1 hypothetical protein MIS33_01595 [Wielerella bovis]ULJ67298.1 hypothetical protein MIS31_01600 [Wielerella bovis]